MLMQLGIVQFQVAPVNIHEHGREAGFDFVEHPVVGTKPPLEGVGEDVETRSLRGRLFPYNLGGLGGLDALDAMRASGQAQPLVRGDGRPLGWFVITKLRETNSRLHPSGVGRIIEFDVTLKKDGPPGLSAILALLTSLLA